MTDKKVNAKIRNDGSIIINLEDPPGCLAVALQKAQVALGYIFVFGLGVLVGLLIGGIS